MIRYLWAKILKRIRGTAIIESIIDKDSKVEPGSHLVNVKMDKYSFCGYDCEIINCEIGKYCSIASNVAIGGAFHPIKWVSTSPVFYSGRDSIKKKFSEYERDGDLKTYIGHDVWIGSNVLIKQGVRVNHGVVIGMGSVVTKDIPSYEIWAGNPARFIKKRFENDIIEELLETEWWNLRESDLKEAAHYIKVPIEFIEICKKIKERQRAK